MRPRALWCRRVPQTGAGCGKEVPLDHFDAGGGCPRPPAPKAWIRSIIRRVLGDERHAGNRITVTRLLGCPREGAIYDNIPLVLDPMDFNATAQGTLRHEEMEKGADSGWVEVPVKGLFLGEVVEGTIDYISPRGVLEDYKTHGESSQVLKWKKGGVENEVRAQGSLYKLLLAQTPPTKECAFPEQIAAGLKVMRVWHGAEVAARCAAPPWFDVELPWMEEEEIAALKPHGAALTVREILGLWRRLQDDIGKAAGDSVKVDAAVNGVPLVGEGIWGGSKCRTYCGALRDCWRLAGRVGA